MKVISPNISADALSQATLNSLEIYLIQAHFLILERERFPDIEIEALQIISQTAVRRQTRECL
jgi:hypothetical protein